MLVVYLSMFPVALVGGPMSGNKSTNLSRIVPDNNWDRGPRIKDDFNSITDVGLYGSSYLLTSCAFQLIYGRIYTFYSPNCVLLFAIAVFEIGVSFPLRHPSACKHADSL